jgi:hypothetical protein
VFARTFRYYSCTVEVQVQKKQRIELAENLVDKIILDFAVHNTNYHGFVEPWPLCIYGNLCLEFSSLVYSCICSCNVAVGRMNGDGAFPAGSIVLD